MRIAKLSRLTVAVGLAGVAVATGCGDDEAASGDSAAPKEIKLAAPIELSGPVAGAGKEWLQYLQFGVDRVNADGGIKSLGGAKLKLLVRDTKSDPASAPAIVRELRQQGAIANVGPIGSAGVVALKPTLMSIGIPWVGVAADPSLTADDSKGTMWRIVGSAEQYAKGAFEFLAAEQDAGKVDIKKIGILSATAPPSPEYKAGIVKFAKEQGWSTVAYDYDFTKQRDYNGLVAKLRSDDVDLVMGQSYPPDALGIAKSVALQDWRPKHGFLWLDGFQSYNDFRKPAGKDVTGWLDASNVAPRSSCDTANELSDAYKKRHGVPIVGSGGGGVSVIAVIAEALERAKSADPADLKKALASTELGFCDGLYSQLGGVRFDAKGNNTAFKPTIVQLTGSQDQVAVAPADAKAGDVTWPAN